MKEVKANMETVFTSISQYFIGGIACKYGRSGYTHFDCITGECNECEGIINPPSYTHTCDSEKMVSYYQYQSVPYTNKAGKEKKRTERIQYETEIKSCKEKLDGMAQKYLTHRFDVEHDKLVWPLIIEKAITNNQMVMHQDYSEKLQEQPKFEPQDMYWSKKSHNLHCTVLHSSNDSEDNQYFYHFSDVLKQDVSFLAVVDADILQSKMSQQKVLRKKTDNCAIQYKSLKVFGYYRATSIATGQTWIVYFGPEGHGRGLVDSMSSFGVKSPLRKEIINKDFYWTTAKELVELFQEKGMPERFLYNEVTKSDYDSQDWLKTAFKIKGCRKLRCFVFHPDGSVETSRHMCECDACFQGDLSQCIYKENKTVEDYNEEEDDDDQEDEEENEDDDENQINVADAVTIGSVIALRTPSHVRESFYLCVVKEVCLNSYYHTIPQVPRSD